MEHLHVGDHVVEERNGKTLHEGEILKVIAEGDDIKYSVRWDDEHKFAPDDATLIYRRHDWGGDQVTIFGFQIAYLVGLAVLAFLYFTSPRYVDIPKMLGPIPVGVPWFGALGGVLISMVAQVEHRDDWDTSYRFFHWAKPFVGASLAVVSVLALQAGILAVGSTPSTNTNVPQNLLFYLLAFLVGYREETFRELIKKLTDVILGPGDTGSPANSVTTAPTTPTKVRVR